MEFQLKTRCSGSTAVVVSYHSGDALADGDSGAMKTKGPMALDVLLQRIALVRIVPNMPPLCTCIRSENCVRLVTLL
jgi:hypothetical protein